MLPRIQLASLHHTVNEFVSSVLSLVYWVRYSHFPIPEGR